MSIVSQNNTNEVALVDCIQRFFSKHHIGKPLKKCKKTKKKGEVPIGAVIVKDGKVIAIHQSSFIEGYTQSAISSSCNGKFNKNGNHHYKGFDWYFKEDYEKMLAEQPC